MPIFSPCRIAFKCGNFWGTICHQRSNVSVNRGSFWAFKLVTHGLRSDTTAHCVSRGPMRGQHASARHPIPCTSPPVPQIHTGSSPKTSTECTQVPHIHTQSSPKTPTMKPISTPKNWGKFLSIKGFFIHQLFKYSSVFIQILKTPPSGERLYCELTHSQ